MRRLKAPDWRRLWTAVAFSALIGWSAEAAADSLASCPPTARAPTADEVREGMKTARDRGFLWRLRQGGRDSYLYGTIHVAKFDWLVPGATLMEAMRASEVIALELDVLDPAIVQRLRDGMAIRPGHTLPGRLAERLKAQLDAACVPRDMMKAMAPEMVATTLTVLSARRQGLDPAYAIDTVVAGWGRALGKPVSSLETPELQLEMLLGHTPEETRAVVGDALGELETGRATPMLSRIARLWAEGRFDELERYAEWCECVDTEDERAMHRRLLDERNPALADRIDALHRSGKRVFAAVGSLHMIGPLGLPALLAQRGYQVERVEFK